MTKKIQCFQDASQVLNSLSRRDGKTHICHTCEDEEALINSGYLKPGLIEKNSLKHIKETKRNEKI